MALFTTNTRQSEAKPQSLNRYAYVQNDPVNFVDPSGLYGVPGEDGDPVRANGGDGFFLSITITAWGVSGAHERPWVDSWTRSFWDPGQGRGHDAAGGGPPQTSQNSQSTCAKFAESLANRLWNGYMAVDPDKSSLINDVGIRMLRNGYNNVDENGNKYVKGKTPIDGFKVELVNNGQGADVYRHILFAAGQALRGSVTDTLFNTPFKGYDWQQAKRGRKESETELRDDAAGVAVGRAMRSTANAGRSGDYAALIKEVRGILCK